MGEIQWKDEYNVGCDYVDSAHKKLFSVIRRVENLIRGNDYERDKFACIEAIKFLKEYTITHFSQEEAFMKEQGYEGLEFHKKLHDELREVTLPELVAELESTEYARESVRKFVSVFIGWLSAHILIEDRAITGKAISRWNYHSEDPIESQLDQRLKKFMKDIQDEDCELITGESGAYSVEDVYCYQINYSDTRLIFVNQYSVILKLAGSMLGEPVTKIDKNVITIYVQLIQAMAKDVLLIARPEQDNKIIAHKMLPVKELNSIIENEKPKYDLRWKSGNGLLGLVILES